MADNFGSQQPRVLDVLHRSLDNVVFQYRKPPLTSEWNLINQISNEKIQELAKTSYPSGWVNVGDILQSWDESNVQTGQANCSDSYVANSFKMFSKNDNVAIVNGWPILVQGTNSVDSNNTIILGSPAGQIYDFVFLEVWRKLVGKDDPIYPYGNVTMNPYSDNEIEWDTIGTETTKRVQIQYRIRVVPIDTTLLPTSTVFDVGIHPIGGRSSGEYSFSTFNIAGASDVGLYIAGDGSSSSQTSLNTVDGYVYAIPMFLVYRRILSDLIFTPSTIKRAYVGKSRLSDGYVSDRPDGKLADIVYKDDVLDYRHKVLTSGKEAESLFERSLALLVAGELTTALKPGFGENGAATSASSGGSTLMKVERINSIGGDDIPDIGTGSNTLSTVFKRRAFCNAEYVHDHNVIELQRTGGGNWVDGDVIDLTTAIIWPDGEIVSIDGFFSEEEFDITYLGAQKTRLVSGVTATGVTTVTVSNSGSYSITDTGVKLYMEFTFKYYSSNYGFKDVPKQMLEANKGNSLPIATRDRTVPIRFNNGGRLLNFGLNPGLNDPGDTTAEDFIRYKGANYTEEFEFGHEMVIFRTTNGSGIVTLNFTDSKYNGYYILGVKSVEPEGPTPGQYMVPQNFTQERGITVSPYEINTYSITIGSYPNTKCRIVLYIGSQFPQDYNSTVPNIGSLKFFETSKQGRGILDTYEVIEAIGVQDVSNPDEFYINTGDKPIIALLTKIRDVSGVTASDGFGFRFNSSSPSFSVTVVGASAGNVSLPILQSSSYTTSLSPTKIKVKATGAVPDVKIRVPLLVHSYVEQSEDAYNFYYKTNAYQGILSSTSSFYGKMSKEGPAFITTMGSGAVANYFYHDGKAVFVYSGDLRKVRGAIDTSNNLPKWLAYVKPGDYIGLQDITKEYQYYRIASVDSDVDLTLVEQYRGAASPGTGENYRVIRMDTPHDNISNVIDRMPSFKIIADNPEDLVDYHCYCDDLLTVAFDGGFYYTRPLHKMQDPMVTVPNDFKIGDDGTSKRGRNNFKLTQGQNSIFNLTKEPRPRIFYNGTITLAGGHSRKVYQTYIFNRSAKDMISGQADVTGRLYMMVVSGESIPQDVLDTSLNGFFSYDTVDLFEIVGRPVVKYD